MKHTTYINDDFYWLVMENQENVYQLEIEVK